MIVLDPINEPNMMNVSSAHVTKIISRGKGSYQNNVVKLSFNREGSFGTPNRVRKALLTDYFLSLEYNRPIDSMYGIDICNMSGELCHMYPGIEYFRKNFLKRWFWQNVNRHLVSRTQFNQRKHEWENDISD